MKLLKFVRGDAPQTMENLQVHEQSLVIPNLNKVWDLQSSEPHSALSCSYWLLEDDGTPVCRITDVILARGHPTGTPAGVTAEQVAGVDFRSVAGRQLESSRANYGQTFRTASKTAVGMMNAEEVRSSRQAHQKREREEVAEKIESGEALVSRDAKKRKSGEKDSAAGSGSVQAAAKSRRK